MSEFKLIDIFKYSHFMHIHYIFYFNFKVGFIFNLCYTNYGIFTFFRLKYFLTVGLLLLILIFFGKSKRQG